MRELYYLFGIKIVLFITWYLQTDRQTEQINQELNQYLQLFISKSKDDWHDIFLLTEF